MRITKFTHACVRIEADGEVLVLDPGSFSEKESVDGATAVLVTHEHADHLSVDNLRATDARIFTIASVAEKIAAEAPDVAERVTTVAPGDLVDAGLPVRVVGEMHAVIHEEIPRIHNSGYLVQVEGSAISHPGDAFTVPDRVVDVLLAPVCAPWSKTAEVIDFVRAVGAPKTFAIHDLVFSEFGLGLVETLLGGRLEGRDQEYRRVTPGGELPV